MDNRVDSLSPVLELLEREGLLSAAQAVSLKIRQAALLQSVIREKQTAKNQRYEVSPEELIAAASIRSPDGNLLSEGVILRALAREEGVEFLHIDPLKLDPKLITETFSRAFASANCVLPIKVEGSRITIATNQLNHRELFETLRTSLRFEPHFVCATKSDILRSIAEIYGFKQSVYAAAEQSAQLSAQTSIGNLEQLVSIRQIDEIDASDSHVVNAVDYLLNYALSQRASDIHIEAKREQSLVRLRIDGILHTIHKLPIAVHPPIVSRLKMLARMDIAEKRKPQDGRIKIENNGKEVELRVSSMPVTFGEKIVMRLLNSNSEALNLENLGMELEDLDNFSQILKQKTGLILVTGPTGSGKTSTLYSCLKAIYQPSINICTIEDPVEIINEAYNQVQVQNKIGLNFHTALRTVLRQDPDVIMVGEIRDEETAHMAVQAALTGHLVLSTLHTNDAASAITRMLDLGVKAFLLSSCLRAVVAQRLIRLNCSNCIEEHALSSDERANLSIVQSAHDRRPLHVKKSKGCPQCRQTGLFSQSAVFEILTVKDSVRKLIHDAAPTERIRQSALSDGMSSLHENAIRKLARGLIPYSEVIRCLGREF